MNLFIRFLGIILVLGVSLDLNQGCKFVPPVDADIEKWFLEIEGKSGWDHPLGSKFKPTGQKSGIGETDAALEGKNQKCFKADISVNNIERSLDMDCRYDNFNSPSCVVNTKDNPLIGKLSGDFSFTMYEAEKYAIVYGCVSGKIDYWVSMVPKGKHLEDSDKEKILKHVKEVLGMGTKQKDLRSEKDPFIFKSFNGIGCKDDKTKNVKGVDSPPVPESVGRGLRR